MREQLDRLASLFTKFGNEDVQQIGFGPFLLLMLVAAASSVLIAYLYTKFYSSRSTGSEVHRTFPLLGISITGIFVCIQFSLPLSLGLLGALSIVRFRTPIKEPEEIGFIMLVIAASLACATFNFGLLLVILGVAVAVLLFKELAHPVFRRRSDAGLLMISMPTDEYESSGRSLLETVSRELQNGQLESITRSDGAVVLSYRFRGLADDRVPALEARLREVAPAGETSLVFSGGGFL